MGVCLCANQSQSKVKTCSYKKSYQPLSVIISGFAKLSVKHLFNRTQDLGCLGHELLRKPAFCARPNFQCHLNVCLQISVKDSKSSFS